jgi:hypothetical protein
VFSIVEIHPFNINRHLGHPTSCAPPKSSCYNFSSHNIDNTKISHNDGIIGLGSSVFGVERERDVLLKPDNESTLWITNTWIGPQLHQAVIPAIHPAKMLLVLVRTKVVVRDYLILFNPMSQRHSVRGTNLKQGCTVFQHEAIDTITRNRSNHLEVGRKLPSILASAWTHRLPRRH